MCLSLSLVLAYSVIVTVIVFLVLVLVLVLVNTIIHFCLLNILLSDVKFYRHWHTVRISSNNSRGRLFAGGDYFKYFSQEVVP